MKQKPMGTVTQNDVSGDVATSFLVPEETWKRVRNLATDRRVSAQSLWLQAMSEYLERHAENADAA